MATKLRAIAKIQAGEDLNDDLSSSEDEMEYEVEVESGAEEDGAAGPQDVVDAIEEEMKSVAPKRGVAMGASISTVRKQKVLIVCTKGVTHQGRHLAQDLSIVLPHSKKEAKVEQKNLYTISEIAEIKNCNNMVCLESRKKQDMYMWVGMAEGPSVRFLLSNVHTMAELKLTGNALKGSRAILSFDAAFDTTPHYKLIKELLVRTFNVPHKHKKSKPFIDRIISFSLVDGHLWFRHFQVIRSVDAKVGGGADSGLTPGTADADKMELVEIGPRFVMEPIRVFAAPFGGKTLWANPHYVSPTVGRMIEKKVKAERGWKRREETAASKVRHVENRMPKNPLDSVFK